MRGDDQQLHSLCGVGRSDSGSSAARGEEAGGCGFGRNVQRFRWTVLAGGTTVDSAGAVTASTAAAGFLFGAERTAADGATELQLAISLVRGLGDRRPDPESRHVQQKRDRLLNQDLAQRFFAQVKAQATGLMSDEHFTVDGTLIEAWAEQKSFRRKDDDKDGAGGGGDFHGESCRNRTDLEHRSEPRLYKKSAGQEAKLSYLGHTLVENRNGLIAAAMTTQPMAGPSATRLY
jgi:hypothetical protein